jgi:hypothetical protein
MEQQNNGKQGRKPKITGKYLHNLRVRLNDEEFAQMQTLMDNSGFANKSNFIRNCIFGREIRVVKTDASLYKTIEWLTKIHSQWRAIGVNYNQTVKQINAKFGEKRAAYLLQNLEKNTIELIKIMSMVTEFIQQLQIKYYDSKN